MRQTIYEKMQMFKERKTKIDSIEEKILTIPLAIMMVCMMTVLGFSLIGHLKMVSQAGLIVMLLSGTVFCFSAMLHAFGFLEKLLAKIVYKENVEKDVSELLVVPEVQKELIEYIDSNYQKGIDNLKIEKINQFKYDLAEKKYKEVQNHLVEILKIISEDEKKKEVIAQFQKTIGVNTSFTYKDNSNLQPEKENSWNKFLKKL